MTLRNTLKSKSRLFLGILVLIFIFHTSIRMVFFQSSKEIIYDYKTTMLSCPKNKPCSFFGNLLLANTGRKNINNLVISLTNIKANIRSRVTTLNLSSADPRENDPIIKNELSELSRTITVNNLSPGTLLDIELTGRSIPDKYKSELKDIQFTLQADAKILRGSPRGTKITRMFSTLLWF